MSGKVAKATRKFAKLPIEGVVKRFSLDALRREYVALYKDYNDLVSASDNLYGGATRMRKVFWSVLIPLGVMCVAGWAICIYQWTR